MKHTSRLVGFLFFLATVAVLVVFFTASSPRAGESRGGVGGSCCPDCTAVKKFVDAVCKEANHIPPIRKICDRYKN